jgi:hypothetical protein
MMTWCDPEWDDTCCEPAWRPRWGMVAVAVLVSCVLWAAILVPLIMFC